MQLVSVLLVAYTLFDFVPVAPVKAPEPVTTFSEQGRGELTVVRSPEERVGSIPRGATRVSFLTLNLSASCDADVTVEDVTLTHVGAGRTTDITGVYVSDGSRRLTRAHRFDSHSAEATLHFTSLVIPKCDAVRLTVYGDFSTSADVASEHGITLKLPTDVRSSAKRTVLSAGDETERIITSPKNSGTITANFLPLSGRLRYGRIETVARLQLSADAQAAHLLKKITFTNQENARDYDLINFTIETRAGKVLTPVAQHMRGKTVTLQFIPSFILSRSENIVLLLKAEVHGSERHKVDFSLEEPSDLEATIYQDR
jgi:hypothetical protein